MKDKTFMKIRDYVDIFITILVIYVLSRTLVRFIQCLVK